MGANEPRSINYLWQKRISSSLSSQNIFFLSILLQCRSFLSRALGIPVISVLGVPPLRYTAPPLPWLEAQGEWVHGLQKALRRSDSMTSDHILWPELLHDAT